MKGTLCVVALATFLVAGNGSLQASETTFSEAQVIAGSSTSRATLGDFDGDGAVDLLLTDNGTGGSGDLYWSQNLGLGVFGPPQTVAIGVGEQPHAAGDIDGDDDVDFVVRGFVGSSSFLYWYENTDGAGTFAAKQLIGSLSGKSISGVQIADIDGDTDADVVAVTGGVSLFGWFENDSGDGSSFSVHSFPTSLIGGSSIHAADMDGDTDLDVLLTSIGDCCGTADVVWFENTDGLGNLGSETGIDSAPSFGNSFNWVSAEDIDDDGDLDVVLMKGGSGSGLKWYENTDGGGSFGASQSIGSPFGTSGFEASDLDGDGDTDFAVIGSLGPYWLEKLGPATFGSPSFVSSSTGNSIVGVNDIDGDADMDLVLSALTVGPIVYHENLSEWCDLGNALSGTSGDPDFRGNGPLLDGATVSLSLTNALPNTSTALVIGISLLNAPFKGGTLVPSPSLILFGLSTDPAGESELVAAWPPNVPSGLAFYFQHWITDAGGPVGFSASNGLSGTTP